MQNGSASGVESTKSETLTSGDGVSWRELLKDPRTVYYRAFIQPSVREYRRTLREVRLALSFDAGLKKGVLPLIVQHERKLAKSYALVLKWMFVCLGASVGLFLVASILSVSLFLLRIKEANPDVGGGVLFTLLCACLFGHYGIRRIGNALGRKFDHSGLKALAYFAALAAFWFLTGWWSPPQNLHEFVPMYVQAAALGGLTTAAMYLGLLLVSSITVGAGKMWLQRTFAHSIIVDNIIALLYLLRSDGASWRQLAEKRKMLGIIERIAEVAEHRLPSQTPSKDRGTDEWMRGKFAEVAAGFRDLKKWVLFPQYTTRVDLRQRLAESLVHTLTGEWHHLPVSIPTRITGWQAGRRVVQWARVLVQASLPLILISLWQLSPFAFPAALGEKLTLGAFLLGAIYLFTGLDATATEKIGHLATIVRSVTTGGPNNKP